MTKLKISSQECPNAFAWLLNMVMNAINPAAFTMVAIKEVNTVGAPSYTSGVQK